MSGARCPCCGQDWPGPERIAFLGNLVVTPLGAVAFERKGALVLRAMHERRGGLPVEEFYAYWRGSKHPEDTARSWTVRANRRLAKAGRRVLRITHRDCREAYGLVEILRNEKPEVRGQMSDVRGQPFETRPAGRSSG